MSHGLHRVTLSLSETPTDILRRELLRAEESARRCEAQGSWWHTWGERARAIRGVLDARARRERRERNA